jgi:hypothetical protein
VWEGVLDDGGGDEDDGKVLMGSQPHWVGMSGVRDLLYRREGHAPALRTSLLCQLHAEF